MPSLSKSPFDAQADDDELRSLVAKACRDAQLPGQEEAVARTVAAALASEVIR